VHREIECSRRPSLGRIGVIAQLVPGARERAEELVAAGPPFDLAEAGFSEHSIFIGGDSVLFVFDGPDVGRRISALAANPGAYSALSHWAPILAGTPRIAHEVFAWKREPS
jgi:hypothetical protein